MIKFPVLDQNPILQAKLNSSQTFFVQAGSTKPKTPASLLTQRFPCQAFCV